MTDSRDGRSGSADDGDRSPELIGAGIGVLALPVFGYLGLVLFGQPIFGAFVGLVIGLGISLAFPAFVEANDRGDLETTPEPPGDRLRRFHRTAAGLALPPAGILLFAWRFVNENVLLGALATAVIGVAIYAPLAVLLPRRHS
ncbi:hypothetical protein [Natrinema altunense]|uniref:Uncharacterized protein n=1 Tax=Natrinema altunense (strain JCM 12890 / CGMCC 1.3731 / AJ2) TaxID=1227494 RepID=L9ZGI6_NATA2|nr:hypothetical protein [Natrinema altunense]ELY84732.1 hypothetical protein C485_15280 [Natrinema altunense JCM 12890]